MSSILKALEKVEEAQSGRRGGAAGFVKSRQRRAPWVLPVAVLSGAVVAAAATFAAMGGFSRHHAPAPQPAVVAQQEPVAVPAPAPVKAAAPKKVVQAQKGAAAAKPVQKAAKAEHKQEHKAAKKERKERLARERERERERNSRRAHRERENRAQALADSAKSVAPPVAAAPVVAAHPAEKPHHALQVTGIAWQHDSASSIAMVNGRPVQQGTVVEGFKVEQIYEDKVRFSGNNGKLEVPLGAGQ